MVFYQLSRPLLVRSCSAIISSSSSGCGFSHRLIAPLVLVQQFRGVCGTPVVRFDIRQHEMEKRRRRELERAGIDVDNDDDEPWIAPEEQQRLDEEEAKRAAEEAERVKEMMKRREEEDMEKRKKFKEFRARQLAMSRNRKEANIAAKHQKRADSRVIEEVIDDTDGSTNKAEGGEIKEEGRKR
ncbi:uncharacterized protein TM35_000081760 [Trypanosoma theileri]|uniref:Uncharacterized protein n=1 Tax=Trypanosoma theileri TaxID=67003 RepID=A0A1X0P0M8_9TRYP|nr:uncharacterized protein TM35_000081760 [Trypanosoma theileri]ORC90378.1 hypothetical protein TM35_000081760 [Trypanosoma theileri]